MELGITGIQKVLCQLRVEFFKLITDSILVGLPVTYHSIKDKLSGGHCDPSISFTGVTIKEYLDY